MMMHVPLESAVTTSSHHESIVTKSLEKSATVGSFAISGEVFSKGSSFSSISTTSSDQSDSNATDSIRIMKSQKQHTPPRSAIASCCKELRRPRRRVRFADEENAGGCLHDVLPEFLLPASEMTPEDKDTIWWQPQDFAVFKKTARVISCEIRRRQVASQTSYQSILWRTYNCCLKAKSEDIEPFEETDRRHLFGWAEVGLCRRGLERWIIPQMAQDRQARKDMVIQGVLHLQKSVKDVTDPTQRMETIRNGCTRLTRSGRLFARALGEADSVAVLNESTRRFR